MERPYLNVAFAYAFLGDAPRARSLLAAYQREIRDTARLRSEQHTLFGVQAEIARAERRYPDAIANYRRSDVAPDGPASACAICLPLGLSRVFDEAGMRDSAIAAYESYVRTPYGGRRQATLDGAHLARMHERLGQLYEAAGDRERARSNYATFVELWKNADPALQPRVAAARQRIATLERR